MDDDLAASVAEFQRCIEARDRVGAEQVVDDDYTLTLVAPSRAIMPRDRWLDVLEGYVIHDYAIEEQIINEEADCAVVLHRVRMTASVLGEDRSGTFVISDVWRRRTDGWRVWQRHSTPLSAGLLPGVDP